MPNPDPHLPNEPAPPWSPEVRFRCWGSLLLAAILLLVLAGSHLAMSRTSRLMFLAIGVTSVLSWVGVLWWLESSRATRAASRRSTVPAPPADASALALAASGLPAGVLVLGARNDVVAANPTAQALLDALATRGPDGGVAALGARPAAEVLAAAAAAPVEVTSMGPPQRQVLLRSAPIGQGTAVLLLDVTRDRQEQRQRESEGRLAAVGQLAAGVAHEFNNILTGIIGLSELLQLDEDLPVPHREDLASIRDQGRRAARLVRQLMDFTHQPAPPLPLLDLGRWLREAQPRLEDLLPGEITLQVDVAKGDYSVRADGGELRQVLENLAGNAREAMAGGGTFTISLQREAVEAGGPPPRPGLRPGIWARLRITDTGSGMAPEVARRAFEPFYTTREVGQGAGLGLSQVYGIVVRHGGFIDVETCLGQGTRFDLWLPLAAPGEEPLPARDSRSRTASARELVLLVEDDHDTRDVVRRLLRELGYSVLTATNGREGLRILVEQGPKVRLVLTDLGMPVMDGAELFRRSRQLPQPPPVVVMSGYPVEEHQSDATLAGVAAWIRKPPALALLAEVLDRVLEIPAKEPPAPELDHPGARPSARGA